MNDKTEAPEKTAKRTEVTLKKAHTHAGCDHKPGDKIKVTDAQAKWLAEQGVI